MLSKLLFPIDCISCGKESDWLCEECLHSCNLFLLGRCYICKRLGENGLCSKCKRITGLNQLIAGYSYKNPLISRLIKQGKYAGFTNALIFLCKNLCLQLSNIDDVVITFVPSSKNAVAKRGFIHTKIIAKELFGKNICNYLRKTKETLPQAGLNRSQRKQNVLNCFIASNAVKGKNVIVVDDIVTTGSTLKEATRALKAAGAINVIAVVLAYD